MIYELLVAVFAALSFASLAAALLLLVVGSRTGPVGPKEARIVSALSKFIGEPIDLSHRVNSRQPLPEASDRADRDTASWRQVLVVIVVCAVAVGALLLSAIRFPIAASLESIVIALVAGLVGGTANLCARLITPGQTFLTPPEGLPTPWSQIMGFLTYTADLVLGAIAGLAVLGVGGVDTSDPLKLIGTCIVAGVGAAGFLVNLGSKAQAEAATVTTRERLNQANGLLVHAQHVAATAQEQVQATLGLPEMPPELANQLSYRLAQIQADAELRPEMPPAS